MGSSLSVNIEIVKGNLLSREDCQNAARDAKVIYHLAAGTGEKSFPDAFLNSVVTTRNLLESTLQHKCLKRFVNISSFAVYSNVNKPHRKILDEKCPTEEHPELRGDAYCFGKLNQDRIVMEYGRKYNIPYVLLRPGVVLGPGKTGITTGRVGIGTFGIFLHLGGSNPVPITYVDNCAEAILLAGIKRGVENEVFNIVDDELPSSRQFLRMYKKNVKYFKSIYVPHAMSYILCLLWERYSIWSQGQLPPVFTRKAWHAYWKGSQYTNEKMKKLCGWSPKVSMSEGLKIYFKSCREAQTHA
jgi:nucleoside-diphosphate-sugar epimerase